MIKQKIKKIIHNFYNIYLNLILYRYKKDLSFYINDLDIPFKKNKILFPLNEKQYIFWRSFLSGNRVIKPIKFFFNFFDKDYFYYHFLLKNKNLRTKIKFKKKEIFTQREVKIIKDRLELNHKFFKLNKFVSVYINYKEKLNNNYEKIFFTNDIDIIIKQLKIFKNQNKEIIILNEFKKIHKNKIIKKLNYKKIYFLDRKLRNIYNLFSLVAHSKIYFGNMNFLSKFANLIKIKSFILNDINPNTKYSISILFKNKKYTLNKDQLIQINHFKNIQILKSY